MVDQFMSQNYQDMVKIWRIKCTPVVGFVYKNNGTGRCYPSSCYIKM